MILDYPDITVPRCSIEKLACLKYGMISLKTADDAVVSPGEFLKAYASPSP